MADIKADGESNAGGGQSFDQMRAASPLRNSMISLSRTGPGETPVNECDRHAAGRRGAELRLGHRCAQKQALERLGKLVPNAKHISATNSGHEIH